MSINDKEKEEKKQLTTPLPQSKPTLAATCGSALMKIQPNHELLEFIWNKLMKLNHDE